jgi:hypothetical protein
MNEYEVQKKVLKGILTQNDLDECTEDILQKVLLMISSRNAIHKTILDFCQE